MPEGMPGKYSETKMESDKYAKQAKKTSKGTPSAQEIGKTISARKKLLDSYK